MKKLLLAATLLSGLATAHAATFPTNTTPAWKSYLATGNTADIVSSPTVAAAIGTKVDATNGQSLNQTLQNPTITGGSAPSLTSTSGSSTQYRSLDSHFHDRLSVLDFGAKCDGTTDDTAAFSLAYSTLNTLGGGFLTLPWTGNCHIKGTLTATTPIVIEGSGKYNSYITQDSPSVDTLVWDGSFYGGAARNFSIVYSNHANTSGSAIYANGNSDFILSDVNIAYPYNGFREDAAGVVRVSGVDVSRAVNDSFLLNGGPLQYLTNVSSFNDDDSPSHAGVEITATGATHLINSGMSGQGVAVLIDPSGTNTQHSGWLDGQAFDIWISNCDLDDSKTNGISLSPGASGLIYGVQIVGTRIGVSRAEGAIIGNSDASINGVVRGVNLTGTQIVGSQKQGLVVYSGDDLSIDGSQIMGNAVLGGTYAGIDLEGGSNITFNGVTSGKWRDLLATQSYGLELGGYFSGNVKFVGGNLQNNITGTYVDYSTVSHSLSISDTIGVNPGGKYLPTVGSSPWTYTAGPTKETLFVAGGTVSSITTEGTTIAVQSNVSIPLNPNQSVVITYTDAPNVIANKD